jgi:hypothetical protein
LETEMTTHKNTKQHTTIAALLLFSIGLLFSSNSFAWTHKIGDKYGGGIVFYVYDGGLHGLIAARADQSTLIQWFNGTFKFTGSTGDGVNAGAMNTAMIVATQINDTPGGNFAAKVCADYSVKGADGVTYGDWYLPSKIELNLLYKQRNVVGGFAHEWYWSSTEELSYGVGDPINSIMAWSQNFQWGYQSDDHNKQNIFRVRAIRAF